MYFTIAISVVITDYLCSDAVMFLPLQGSIITDSEGQGNFNQLPQQSLDNMLTGKTAASISFYDETALCSTAFK